ncbi:MAG: hypothetical protein ACI9Q3_001023, partial [Maribacter sp.]
MQKVLTWQVPNITEISNENVGSILLNVNPRIADGGLAPITDLNQIEFAIGLTRGNNPEINIFDGYLGDMLQFLHGGTTKHEIALDSNVNYGYMFNLEFAHAFDLTSNDRLTIKTNFGLPSKGFSGAVINGSTV